MWIVVVAIESGAVRYSGCDLSNAAKALVCGTCYGRGGCQAAALRQAQRQAKRFRRTTKGETHG